MELLNLCFKNRIFENITPSEAIYNMRELKEFGGSIEQFKQSYLIHFDIYHDLSDKEFLLFLETKGVLQLEFPSQFSEVLRNV